MAINSANAWNAVNLEERLELVSHAQANGVASALTVFLFLTAIAYGFDKVWLLAFAAVIAVLVVPVASSYTWRRGKPKLVLEYLAVRSVARRYAYSANISELDLLLIFRGTMQEILNSEDRPDGESLGPEIEVWIALLRGAIVILSERPGGAKLNFLSSITSNLECGIPTSIKNPSPGSLEIQGAGIAQGRSILLNSRYRGAFYLFEKRVAQLMQTAKEKQQRIEALQQIKLENRSSEDRAS